MLFHSRTGSLVTLSNGNKTAHRNHPGQEFNNGVVISAEPLTINQLFEVKIDRKVCLLYRFTPPPPPPGPFFLIFSFKVQIHDHDHGIV